jgi:hypothetical protein
LILSGPSSQGSGDSSFKRNQGYKSLAEFEKVQEELNEVKKALNQGKLKYCASCCLIFLY